MIYGIVFLKGKRLAKGEARWFPADRAESYVDFNFSRADSTITTGDISSNYGRIVKVTKTSGWNTMEDCWRVSGASGLGQIKIFCM